MKINAKFTTEPILEDVTPMSGAQKIVDADGAVICFLRSGELYDLNQVYFASCKRVDKATVQDAVDAFTTDGKYLYHNGIIEGKVKKDHTTYLIILLALLLAMAITSLSIFTCNVTKPTKPNFTVVDVNGDWGTTGSVNIFGDKAIKPGDNGSYVFMVNNPHAVKLDCTIKFKFKYENGTSLPPIKYSLVSEGQTLTSYKFDEGFMVYDVIIDKKNSRSFRLEWNWEFESGNDDTDTIVGIIGDKYVVSIEISAEEA